MRHARVLLAAHPIPDEAGLEGARRTLALARQAGPGDVVLTCYRGRSSALLSYPVAGISLEEKQVLERQLLSCGANISEINAVRKHLSQVKGGRLAMAIDPQAQLVTLTVSDVIGDPLDVITDPTVPRDTGIDFHTCLKQHDVTQVLVRLGGAVETGATGTNVNDPKLLLVVPAG